jgi:hypothetical protein
MEWSEYSFVLKPSPWGGVGVFATHDMAHGTVLFRPNITHVRTFAVKDVPPAFIKYCIYIDEHTCIGPQAFDRMEISWYINHSATPNVSIKKCPASLNGEPRFWAIKDIAADTEIVMDYNELDEPESVKEPFYY